MPGVENANAETWLVVSGQFSSCPTDHWPLTTDHRPLALLILLHR